MAFKARGIKVNHAPEIRPQNGRTPRGQGSGFDLQNAYAAHVQRQANPAFGGGGSDLSQEVSSPFTQGVKAARADAVAAKTGQSATMYERRAGDLDANGQWTQQGKQNADQFNAREKLAGSDMSDAQFSQSLTAMGKTDETGAKQTAFGHAAPHIPEAQRDLYQQMASDPNVTAHDFYGHLIQATTPAKGGASDPMTQYRKYAALHGELAKEDASDPQVARALASTHDEMSKLLDQISPPGKPPVVRTPQPADATTPQTPVGDGAMRANVFSSRPLGGAATPPIAGLGGAATAEPTPAAPATNAQYKMGQMIPVNGKQYQVSGFDPDGHPRVREFVPPAQGLPGAASNPTAAQ